MTLGEYPEGVPAAWRLPPGALASDYSIKHFTDSDVTQEAGVLAFFPTQTATWGDYNNDGQLDLFVGSETGRDTRHPCLLYHNNGDGTFTDIAKQVGVDVYAYVKGSAWGD